MAIRPNWINHFIKWSAKAVSKPIAFVIAVTFVGLWLLAGPFFGFSDSWLLIMNTMATINAALIVFIIQHTQSPESKALHLKVDELIRATQKASNELMSIEEMEEEELEKIRKNLIRHKKKKRISHEKEE